MKETEKMKLSLNQHSSCLVFSSKRVRDSKEWTQRGEILVNGMVNDNASVCSEEKW